MITFTASVCKKVGTPNYGSNGATCSLAGIELDDQLLHDPPALAAKIRAWYALAQQAVEEELTRLGNGQPAAQARSPVASPAPPPVAARPSRTALPPPPAPDEFNELDDDQAEDDNDGPPPRTGGQLLGWARKQPTDMKGFILGFGRKQQFPTKVLDWTEKEVQLAYAQAKKSQQQKR